MTTGREHHLAALARKVQRRSPAEVVDYLNRLFGFMVEIINARGGIVNKFLGDGFMAVLMRSAKGRGSFQDFVPTRPKLALLEMREGSVSREAVSCFRATQACLAKAAMQPTSPPSIAIRGLCRSSAWTASARR